MKILFILQHQSRLPYMHKQAVVAVHSLAVEALQGSLILAQYAKSHYAVIKANAGNDVS